MIIPSLDVFDGLQHILGGIVPILVIDERFVMI